MMVSCRMPPPSPTVLLKVRDPVPVEVSPRITSPPIVTALPKVRAVALLEERVPPSKDNPPVPKAALSPTLKTPLVTVTPPEKVLAAERVKVPVPALESRLLAPPVTTAAMVCDPFTVTTRVVAVPSEPRLKVFPAPPRVRDPVPTELCPRVKAL